MISGARVSITKNAISESVLSPKIIFLSKGWGFSGIIWGVLVSPKINNIGVGAHGHVRNPEVIEMRDLRVFI